MNKDQAYHQIALACLKALRNPNAAEAEDQIQMLYKVIDQAFEQQFALVLAELEDCKARLSQIESLDPAHNTLADAQAIASHQGTAH